MPRTIYPVARYVAWPSPPYNFDSFSCTLTSPNCQHTLLEIQEDLPRAVRFVRHNSARFGIEENRIGVTGMSSGGHLALLLGTAARGEDESADDPVDRESSRVQAVVAYCPNSDLLNYGKPNETISEHFAGLRMKLDAVFDFH